MRHVIITILICIGLVMAIISATKQIKYSPVENKSVVKKVGPERLWIKDLCINGVVYQVVGLLDYHTGTILPKLIKTKTGEVRVETCEDSIDSK